MKKKKKPDGRIGTWKVGSPGHRLPREHSARKKSWKKCKKEERELIRKGGPNEK